MIGPVVLVARRTMLIAVNRELKTMPAEVQACATAALAQHLAREVDAGDRPAAGPLMRALNDLRRMSAPAKTSTAAAPEDEVVADELDDLARARAARLADASGVVSPIGGHERRTGGRQAR
ncbi:MAG: hypothetical protein EPO40_03185 [Myxococcaceae bacterium]|nr:MAG: hypothetical protein EPO40_03185 [Myxococcaceae bacterium]